MMLRSNSAFLLFSSLLIFSLSGCAASPWAARSAAGPEISPANGPATPPGPQLNPTAEKMPNLPVPGPPVPSPMAGGAASPQALQAVMAEVERIGSVDPQAQALLLEELKQTDPGLWPLAVKNIRSKLAYARRFHSRQHDQNAQHVAARRTIHTDTGHQTIYLRGDDPASYPNTADLRYSNPPTSRRSTAGNVQYPTTADTFESPSPGLQPAGRGAEHWPGKSVDPCGGRSYDSKLKHIPAPPSVTPLPDDGDRADARRPYPLGRADLDAVDRGDTIAESRAAGVIHASYNSQQSHDRADQSRPHAASTAHSPSTGPMDASAERSSGDGDWQARLDEAIEALEARLAASDSESSDADDSRSDGSGAEDPLVADHARLRLLRLMAGRRHEALAEMPIDDPALRDFWSKELFALDMLLDAQRFSTYDGCAAEAKQHLSEAAMSLGESAALQVRNLAFCREVQSYGSIKQFAKREFAPGQRVLLYAEIDNFRSENTPRGYHTSLRSSFQIFDSHGHPVDKRESTTTEEHCLSPRRDYFIGCDFCLPTDVYPGRYTLKLTVEDLKSHKAGESTIDFTIVKR